MNNADLKDFAREIKLAELYVGAGNEVTYFDEQHGLQLNRRIVRQDETRVEVVVYVIPGGGARTNYPHAASERTFEWVDKLAITRINDEPVSIVA